MDAYPGRRLQSFSASENKRLKEIQRKETEERFEERNKTITSNEKESQL
ncbi:hypothetical protein [Bacillus thuringiensis]|nr:hypothetical protein [Bacillus thuringiensis]